VKLKCTESSPEGNKVCTKDRMSEQVKGLAGKVVSRDAVRDKDCRHRLRGEKCSILFRERMSE